MTYLTKMKKNLRYETLEDVMYMTQEGVMEHRVQQVVFTKRGKGGEALKHRVRIITYADRKKHKTNFDSRHHRDLSPKVGDWTTFQAAQTEFSPQIFLWRERQCHQNSDLGHMLMVLQKLIKRNWSFSNLATMVRIMLMNYIDCYSFFEHPEKDWLKILDTHDPPPAEPSLFD